MRIVDTDNFCRDYPGEKFVLWSFPEHIARRIADALNDWAGPNAQRYYMVVEEDYKLIPGFEP